MIKAQDFSLHKYKSLLGNYVIIVNVDIKIKKTTKTRLEKFGKLSSTHDSLLNEILDHLNICDSWWNKK